MVRCLKYLIIQSLVLYLLCVNFLNSCVLTVTLIAFQEIQRNGKAGLPVGRWPSLLSLTCPRSSCSGSGSEASLSSACSEYSSGSHTWAEGRGSSKVGLITLVRIDYLMKGQLC